jgi:hypothetical protein
MIRYKSNRSQRDKSDFPVNKRRPNEWGINRGKEGKCLRMVCLGNYHGSNLAA